MFPHSRQNFDVAGILALQFGHIMRAAAGVGAGPVGVIICGMSTIPVPRPAPGDFPSSLAASFTVSILNTSSAALVCLSQNKRSLNSGVVSIPSKRRSVRSSPIRLKASKMSFFTANEVSSNFVNTVTRSYRESSSIILSLT